MAWKKLRTIANVTRLSLVNVQNMVRRNMRQVVEFGYRYEILDMLLLHCREYRYE